MYKGDFSPYPFENVPSGANVDGLPASADKFWLCHTHPQPLQRNHGCFFPCLDLHYVKDTLR
jgi:hypothetical protein